MAAYWPEPEPTLIEWFISALDPALAKCKETGHLIGAIILSDQRLFYDKYCKRPQWYANAFLKNDFATSLIQD